MGSSNRAHSSSSSSRNRSRSDKKHSARSRSRSRDNDDADRRHRRRDGSLRGDRRHDDRHRRYHRRSRSRSRSRTSGASSSRGKRSRSQSSRSSRSRSRSSRSRSRSRSSRSSSGERRRHKSSQRKSSHRHHHDRSSVEREYRRDRERRREHHHSRESSPRGERVRFPDRTSEERRSYPSARDERHDRAERVGYTEPNTPDDTSDHSERDGRADHNSHEDAPEHTIPSDQPEPDRREREASAVSPPSGTRERINDDSDAVRSVSSESPHDRKAADAVSATDASDESDARSGSTLSSERETVTASREAPNGVQDATTQDGKDAASQDVKDAAAFRFEHLEAVRNVQLITRNEYPLAHLKRERLVHRDYDAMVDDDDDDSAVCYCSYPDATDKDKRRCDDVSCLNYATYVECNSQCPAREHCCNQRLQRPELFPALEAFKTEHKGFGVRTTEDIAQSRIIGEYVGEIIDQKELTLRLKSAPRNELNFYYLLLEPGVYIDARNKGSFTRFVNHSCEPNCKTEKWTVKGETRIAVIALRDISAGEELTFDYQWKSLGSRQIKCFCESANCKGVIGTEGDTVKDDAPKGVFREPNKMEIGAAIVNRRIRIFKSPDDHSMYYIATIQSYDKSDGVYEVDYQDTIEVDDDADDDDGYDSDGAFGSAGNSSGAKSGERFVRLNEMDWQIFVELDGMSEDQIEKEVFSIPKRRVAESREPSPKYSDAEAVKLSREPSPSAALGLVTGRSISNAPLVAYRKNANGESVDADGNVVTTKLLIKGVSTKCDAATLRQLFVSNDRRHHHRAAVSGGAAAAAASLVTDLDLFFFDDSGWALVELLDTTSAELFQRKLNNRPLHGKSLRIYHAGRKEVETFTHAKLRRRHAEAKRSATASLLAHTPAADTTDRTAALTSTSSMPSLPSPPAKQVVSPYCFGRKLNWQVSVEQMEESPSRRLGISPSLEQSLRTKCVKVVQRLMKRLHLDRADATSAIIALTRYYTFHAMNVRNVEFLAAAMLHVFLKAHSRRFSWTAFVSEVYAAKTSTSSSSASSALDVTKQLSDKSDEFQATERQLLSVERELLDGLRYDLSSEDPYALLDSLIGEKTRVAVAVAAPSLAVAVAAESPSTAEDSTSSQASQTSQTPQTPLGRALPPPEVQREARQLVSDVLRLPIWVQTPAECIVLSIVYVSAAVTQALKERTADASSGAVNSSNNMSLARPAYLPVLDARRNELESLMLLECALSLCDSLKDRWLRLEKLAKASRKSSRSGDDVFDTEAFAVTRTKPVELSERIAQLLKAWVDLPSSYGVNAMARGASVSPERDASGGGGAMTNRYITLSMVGKANVSTGADRFGARSNDSDIESASAAAVVPKHVVKAAGGGSSSVLSSADRLHASDITAVDMIRKRAYLGVISLDVPFDVAGRRVYVQSWPNRDHGPPFSPEDGSISKSCVRELSAAIALSGRWPRGFVKLLGIVFPDEKKSASQATSSGALGATKPGTGDPDSKHTGGDALDVDMAVVDFADVTALAATGSTSSSSSRLDSGKHYLAFEQPLHLYSGVFDAKVTVPMQLKLRAIYDMLESLAVCHELHYVHRSVAPSHLLIFKHGVKLGGYHAVRKTSSTARTRDADADAAYEMTESERKDLCVGSSVTVAAPEVLLGDLQFTWRSDIWSAGCVALAILFDNSAMLLGADVKMQLDKVFRLCGTPSIECARAAALPLYRLFKPPHEYKTRLRKTLSEVSREKQLGVSDHALALLECMLQLDPAKRSSARELLALELFADVRRAMPATSVTAFDFSVLPETFAVQRKKLLTHLRASKPKRRRPSSASGDYAPSSSSAAATVLTASASGHHHHRSSSLQSHHHHSRKAESHARSESRSRGGSGSSKSSRGTTSEVAEDVPLPAFFHAPADVASSSSTGGSGSSKGLLSPRRMLPPRPEKRAKLGWGMGLHSNKTT